MTNWRPYRRDRLGSVAVKTKYNGRTYASKAEAARAEELDLHVETGVILGWVRQVTFQLGPDHTWRADFLVFETTLHETPVTVEDVKGRETERFAKVRKLWAKYGPCPLRVLKRKGDKWDVEIVNGKATP